MQDIKKGTFLTESLEVDLLVSWLLKDFGWVLVFPVACLPSAVVAVSLSLYLLRLVIRAECSGHTVVHHLIEIFWLLGNVIWMTTEMFFDNEYVNLPWRFKPMLSNREDLYVRGTVIGFICFSAGALLFASQYLRLVARHCRRDLASDTDRIWGFMTPDDYRRFFIGFWIGKDMCWQCERFFEGLMFGIIAFAVVADSTRRSWNLPERQPSDRVSALVEILWITGNIVWMTEELALNEGDGFLRVVVAMVFLIGMCMLAPHTTLLNYQRHALKLTSPQEAKLAIDYGACTTMKGDLSSKDATLSA